MNVSSHECFNKIIISDLIAEGLSHRSPPTDHSNPKHTEII